MGKAKRRTLFERYDAVARWKDDSAGAHVPRWEDRSAYVQEKWPELFKHRDEEKKENGETWMRNHQYIPKWWCEVLGRKGRGRPNNMEVIPEAAAAIAKLKPLVRERRAEPLPEDVSSTALAVTMRTLLKKEGAIIPDSQAGCQKGGARVAGRFSHDWFRRHGHEYGLSSIPTNTKEEKRVEEDATEVLEFRIVVMRLRVKRNVPQAFLMNWDEVPWQYLKAAGKTWVLVDEEEQKAPELKFLSGGKAKWAKRTLLGHTDQPAYASKFCTLVTTTSPFLKGKLFVLFKEKLCGKKKVDELNQFYGSKLHAARTPSGMTSGELYCKTLYPNIMRPMLNKVRQKFSGLYAKEHAILTEDSCKAHSQAADWKARNAQMFKDGLLCSWSSRAPALGLDHGQTFTCLEQKVSGKVSVRPGLLCSCLPGLRFSLFVVSYPGKHPLVRRRG